MRRILFVLFLILVQLFCATEMIYASNQVHFKPENDKKILAANLSGLIWYDQNLNGMFDNFESPLPNVPVLLFRCNGQFVNATISQNDGAYSFNNVPNGGYKIYVSLANLGNIYSFTFQSPDTDNDINESGYSECILANNGNFELDAGITIYPTIGDKVWEDLNGNGIQDFGEPGIKDVVVEAYSNGELVADAVTNVNGNYSFNTLLPGNYVFRFLAPTGYISTKHIPLVPSNSKITKSNGPFTTDEFQILSSSDFSIDAGFYRCAQICGTLYNDINESDSLNLFENGINGIRVNLWQIINGDSLIYDFANTSLKPGSPSNDGYYGFCVPPGTYFVEIDRSGLSDYLTGAPLATNDPETFNHFFENDDILASYDITLESNDTLCYINQGFYCTGEISSKVWLDANQNGLQDANETVMENIQVELRNAAGDLMQISTTDEFGMVTFDKVRKGPYYLKYSIGSEFIFTNPFQGPVLIDSDVNGFFGEGTTSLFNLTSCSTLLGIDAGVSLRPLPLTWLHMDVKNISKGINHISWEVAKEVNVSHYNVQKSLDGISWSNIGKVEAQGVADANEYNYQDTKADQKDTYYRIQSLDYDGAISYSEIAYIKSEHKGLQMMITPNPAISVVDILLSDLNENEAVSITINNQLGQKVIEIQHATSLTSVSLENVPDGIYYVRVKTDSGQQYTQKLVVEK